MQVLLQNEINLGSIRSGKGVEARGFLKGIPGDPKGMDDVILMDEEERMVLSL